MKEDRERDVTPNSKYLLLKKDLYIEPKYVFWCILFVQNFKEYKLIWYMFYSVYLDIIMT